MSARRKVTSARDVGGSAAARAIVARLRLVEEFMRLLEMSDARSLEEWRKDAGAARKSARGSALRGEFRKRVRAAKGRWKPIRNLLIVNAQTFYDMSRGTSAATLRGGHAVDSKCMRERAGHGSASSLTLVGRCWILCGSCVECARNAAIAVIEKQQQLPAAAELMDAVAGSAATGQRDSRLFNGDGSMKEGVFRILKALDVPCAKIEGIRKKAGFVSASSVSEFTSAMRDAGWIARGRDGLWRRTRSGTAALRTAVRGEK
jgi:hypothetical protein